MASPLDFSAELSQQLKQAAAKMKAMREPASDGAAKTTANAAPNTAPDVLPSSAPDLPSANTTAAPAATIPAAAAPTTADAARKGRASATPATYPSTACADTAQTCAPPSADTARPHSRTTPQEGMPQDAKSKGRRGMQQNSRSRHDTEAVGLSSPQTTARPTTHSITHSRTPAAGTPGTASPHTVATAPNTANTHNSPNGTGMPAHAEDPSSLAATACCKYDGREGRHTNGIQVGRYNKTSSTTVTPGAVPVTVSSTVTDVPEKDTALDVYYPKNTFYKKQNSQLSTKQLSHELSPNNGAHSVQTPPSQEHSVHRDALSPSPTLSATVWGGGVKRAVLDALRTLAQGEPHVLVNLKRLAVYAQIPYGSVRNAVSRLVQTGDISTRQIRTADGHGVRVTFLTAQGQEGTADKTFLAPRGGEACPTSTPPAAPFPALRTGNEQATDADTAHMRAPTPTQTFWATKDSVFAVAWPFAAAAGLNMAQLRSLQDVYAAQGFTPENLPQNLRDFDSYLEQQPPAEYPRLAAEFLRILQRKGCWTAPL